MEIMALLKIETAAYHAKLESLPYFFELIAHRLPLECYVNQLRAFSSCLVTDASLLKQKNQSCLNKIICRFDDLTT